MVSETKILEAQSPPSSSSSLRHTPRFSYECSVYFTALEELLKMECPSCVETLKKRCMITTTIPSSSSSALQNTTIDPKTSSSFSWIDENDILWKWN